MTIPVTLVAAVVLEGLQAWVAQQRAGLLEIEEARIQKSLKVMCAEPQALL